MTNRLEEYMTKPMKRRLGLLSPLCFFGAVLFFPVASGQETYRLEGNRVAVYNLAGRAEIVTGSGNAVEVLVERGGSDAWALQATVTEVGGAEGLVFNYPGDRVVYPAFGREPATENRVRDDGTFLSGAGKGWGRMVELSGSGRGVEAWANLRISVPPGRTLALYLLAGDVEVRSVEGHLHLDMGTGSAEIRQGRGSLDVQTGSGRVSVLGFAGDVHVAGGSVNVDLLEIDGEALKVSIGSGRVRASNVAASESFWVNTSAGAVEVKGLSSPSIHAASGTSVDLEILKDVDELAVTAGPRGAVLRLPVSLGAAVVINTKDGTVDTEVPLVEERGREGRRYYRGAVGDGRGTIRVVTVSGGVRIVVDGA